MLFRSKLAQERGYDFLLVPGTKESTIRFAHKDSDGNLITSSLKGVYKYDDEWFMVVGYSDTTYTPLNLKERYYKCDGFEGLVRCLGDILDK